MDATWTPLSAREAPHPFALREEVPQSLERALRDWTYAAAQKLPGSARRLMIRLDLVLPQEYADAHKNAMAKYRAALKLHELGREHAAAQGTQQAQPNSTSLATQAATPTLALPPVPPPSPQPQFIAYGTPTSRLLEILDALLDLLPYKPPPPPATDPVTGLLRLARRAIRGKEREQLQELLEDGHMIYRVRADGRGLERRASAIATAAAVSATTSAERAGYPAAAQRLIRAWDKAYALKPDPSSAYHDAIRAVEAIACPLFLPKANTPSLGTVLTHLDDARSKYRLVIADKTNTPAPIDAIIEMIRTLWHGHRDRHEGGPTSGPITQESAQAAITLAICLVQLLSTGCIQQQPTQDRCGSSR